MQKIRVKGKLQLVTTLNGIYLFSKDLNMAYEGSHLNKAIDTYLTILKLFIRKWVYSYPIFMFQTLYSTYENLIYVLLGVLHK